MSEQASNLDAPPDVPPGFVALRILDSSPTRGDWVVLQIDHIVSIRLNQGWGQDMVQIRTLDPRASGPVDDEIVHGPLSNVLLAIARAKAVSGRAG